MKFSELRLRLRQRLNDISQPYLWGDDELDRYLSDAQLEACTRARLLQDSLTKSVCEVQLVAGETQYKLHPSIQKVLSMSTATSKDVDGTLERGTLVLDSAPVNSEVLNLIVWRLPICEFSPDKEPEIARHYHLDLVHWAAHLAWMVDADDQRDPSRSAQAAQEFESVFGQRDTAQGAAMMSKINPSRRRVTAWRP